MIWLRTGLYLWTLLFLMAVETDHYKVSPIPPPEPPPTDDDSEGDLP